MKFLAFLRKYRIFGFILIFFGMIAAAVWAISLHFEPMLNKAIKNAVFKSTNELYTVDFEKINTNILLGTANIKKLKLRPNWNAYDSLKKINKAPDNVYEISLDNLKIRGFNPYKIFKNKDLAVSKIRLEKPNVVMYHHPFTYNDGKKLLPQSDPYQIISKYLNNFSIDAVELQDVHFKYIDRDSAKKNIEFNNLQAHLLNWELNEKSHLDNNRFYYFDDAIFILPSYQFHTRDSLYEGNWKNISLLFKEKKITVESFEIHPTVNIDRFQEKLGIRKISIGTNLENIHLNHVDMPAFLRKGQLLVKNLHINSGSLSLKNGKGIVQKTEDRPRVIPHELLQKISLPFVVDTVMLNQIDIDYQEYNKKTNKNGIVTFGKSSFFMRNVTNMPHQFKKNNKMIIHTNTQLMNKAPFNFELSMIYGSPLGDFNIKGNVGALNGRIFNQITVPMGLITIKSLDVQSMNFNISGNNKVLKGNMTFRYKDLSVSIMEKDEESGILLRKGLLSMLANKWVLETENPRTNGTLVTAPLYLERPLSFGFSKFIWKALQNGIKYSVGITPEKEASIKSKIKDFNHLKENFQSYKAQLKKQRTLNKERRIKRRELRAQEKNQSQNTVNP